MLFLLMILGLLIDVPLYLISINHTFLRQRFGPVQGDRVGKLLGMVSGWGFFLCLGGIWLSPQPRWGPSLLEVFIIAPSVSQGFQVAYLGGLIGLLGLAMYLGIKGVRDLSLMVSETHLPNQVIQTGLYQWVRHPQYLAALFGHFAMCLGFAGMYAWICSPLIILVLVMFAQREERELIKEFGSSYRDYQQRVPMFLPWQPRHSVVN